MCLKKGIELMRRMFFGLFFITALTTFCTASRVSFAADAIQSLPPDAAPFENAVPPAPDGNLPPPENENDAPDDDPEVVWAKDARPFKRRAEFDKNAREREILSSPEQMRRELGTPHEMPDLPVSNEMPAGFTTAEPPAQDTASQKKKRRLPPLARSPIKRGGAGGNVRKVEREEPRVPVRQTASEPAQNAASADDAENMNQDGLKMFDGDTAKDVMNINPNSKEMNNLPPALRQKLLDDVVVNRKNDADKTDGQSRGKRKSRDK